MSACRATSPGPAACVSSTAICRATTPSGRSEGGRFIPLTGGRLAAAGVALAAASHAGPALAWAWPLEPGKTQLILKYEGEQANEMFDQNAITQSTADQHQETVSLFFERGVTERLTLQGKVGWTRGADLFTRYEGRGPVDFGARYVVFRNSRTVVTVYGGGVVEGEGPDASHTLHRSGAPGFEVRLLAGRSGTFLHRHVFSELQLADLERGQLPRETRIETTLGIEPRRGWLVLAQTYAGREDKRPVAPLWLKAETSVLHDLPKGWRVQAGYRWTELGIEMPVGNGPVLALWRTF